VNDYMRFSVTMLSLL